MAGGQDQRHLPPQLTSTTHAPPATLLSRVTNDIDNVAQSLPADRLSNSLTSILLLNRLFP